MRLALALAATLAASVAFAQPLQLAPEEAPPMAMPEAGAPPPFDEAGPMEPDGPMPQRGMRRHGREGGPPPFPPSKAANFRIVQNERGSRLDIKCADDEPTRACVDEAMRLFDRVVAGTPRR